MGHEPIHFFAVRDEELQKNVGLLTIHNLSGGVP